MNSWVSFLPALLGVVVVLQAGLNKKISAVWGISGAVLLNALVFLVIAIVAYFFVPNMKGNIELKSFNWWYLVPGTLGCILVFGGPMAIMRWGAVHTFILIISAQLLASLVWDSQIEGMPVSTMRIAGIALAWIGAVLVCKA
ncbi:DMT family transporter [Pseudobdellovibrio sp. HCB154]|uniref:DMT family transporter n=1 Tax=Pseudobdellovibrio sp. HCB154 TaxID=3386277 RepID=UPI003916E3EE